jgi:hypothetical protein
MASEKKVAGKKPAGAKKARLRDLPWTDKGQEELTDEQAQKVKGGLCKEQKQDGSLGAS